MDQLLEMIVAVARVAKIDPHVLARAFFVEGRLNKQYFDEVEVAAVQNFDKNIKRIIKKKK